MTVAVKAFLYVGANLFTPHIAAPIYLLCIHNKIREKTHAHRNVMNLFFLQAAKIGVDCDRGMISPLNPLFKNQAQDFIKRILIFFTNNLLTKIYHLKIVCNVCSNSSCNIYSAAP